MQTRRKGQFCFVLTCSLRLCAFLNKGIFDSRLNSDNSYCEKWTKSSCDSSNTTQWSISIFGHSGSKPAETKFGSRDFSRALSLMSRVLKRVHHPLILLFS